MKENLEISYRGHKINFDSGFFLIEGEAYGGKTKSLQSACDQIDRTLKGVRPGIERTPVFWFEYGSTRIEVGTATSITDDGGHAWVTSGAQGRREKKDATELYLDTPENRELITRLRANEKEWQAEHAATVAKWRPIAEETKGKLAKLVAP